MGYRAQIFVKMDDKIIGRYYQYCTPEMLLEKIAHTMLWLTDGIFFGKNIEPLLDVCIDSHQVELGEDLAGGPILNDLENDVGFALLDDSGKYAFLYDGIKSANEFVEPITNYSEANIDYLQEFCEKMSEEEVEKFLAECKKQLRNEDG